MASTYNIRSWYPFYRCSSGVLRPEGFFGRHPVYEQEITHDAVTALEQGHYGSRYEPEQDGFIGSRRNCPKGIAGAICQESGSGCSLHNYCLAYDVEYNYNRYIRARITPKDFDEEWFPWVCKYTLAQVLAIENIRNIQGDQMWRWLGWSIGDFMHWQINVPSWQLKVDWNTVPDIGVEGDMNMIAFVNAAFDSGNPAVQPATEAGRKYWLNLAATDSNSPEFYNLIKAALTPAPALGTSGVKVTYTTVVKDIS